MRAFLHSLIAKLQQNQYIESIRHVFGFQREYWRNRRQTGSVTASSPALARAIVEPYWDPTCDQDVLEIGSGTGIISGKIFRCMRPDDRLTIVEINPNFLATTRRKLVQRFGVDAIADSVSLINEDFLQNQMPADRFSRVCCSLPLNNFEPQIIREIFQEIFRVCQPGGIVVFYEYILLRRMRYWLSLGTRQNLKKIEAVLSDQIRRHGIEEIPIYTNFPPAMVYILRKAE